MGVAWRILGVALGFTFAWPARAQFGVPDAPIDVALDVLSGSDVQITFEAPLTDGGAAVQAYNIEWDTDPGDICCTGTPPGVGENMSPPHFLKGGEEVILGIDKLGEQKHSVVSYKD